MILEDDIQYLRRKLGNPEIFQGKTVFITGAAGFLGYYFAQFFARAKVKKLILADIFLLDRPRWIEVLAAQPEIEARNLDITTNEFQNLPGVAEADYIIHMASIASPVYYRKYPIETIKANVLGLLNLLDFYRGKPIQGFLFFSSSEIYGDPDAAHIPTAEDYRGSVACVGPRACYDESKRIGETICQNYAEVHGLPIGVARPFNNYGPGMRLGDKRVPADFAKAVVEGKDIVMLSDGSPTRTFCYVADAMVGYLKVLTHGRYGYFNIGIDRPEITIRDLAAIYAAAGKKVFGYTGQIRFETASDKHYLTDNPNRRCPILDKARRELDYQPEIGVEQGVERFLQFLKEERI
jgi:UDP-glucuronate decarboxylase